MFNPFSLEGKNILITGASSGIGRQIAIDCSYMGANLILTGRNKERLTETYSLLQKNNHQVVVTELTDYEVSSKAIGSIIEKIGPLNGIVNNAGISLIRPLKNTSIETMEDFFKVNVISAVSLTKACVKKRNFNSGGGSVVFISSIMGVVGEKAKFLYGMTKGALISGARHLAMELASRKIRVNCISPGAIETPINANTYMADQEQRKILEEKHPLGLGDMKDIASAAIFLLSDASRWITGQNLIVDGGYTSQ